MKRGQELLPIIFDCDDVLLNWQEGFRRWMKSLRGIDLDPAGPKSWNMDEWVCQPAMPLVSRFNMSHTFGSLHPVAGAKEAVAALYAAGHNLHVVTACSDDPIVIRRREQNLDRVFGDVFTSITCVPLGSSKANALKSLPRGIWVEDNVEHAIVGHLSNNKTFIMRRGHNAQREIPTRNAWPNITWIDDFKPILNATFGQLGVA